MVVLGKGHVFSRIDRISGYRRARAGSAIGDMIRCGEIYPKSECAISQLERRGKAHGAAKTLGASGDAGGGRLGGRNASAEDGGG